MFTKKIIFYIFIVLINSFIFIGLEWLAGRSIFIKNIYQTVGLMEGLHPFMEYDKDLGYRIRRQAMEKPTATFEIKTSPYKSIPGKFNFTPSEGVIRSENGDIAINRLGFRGPNFKEKQGSNIFRIIALGGSTTAGMYQNQLTYPRLLERMLNQSQVNKRHFQVINAGMWGHNTCQVKTRFRNEIIDLNPNFIILMSGWNDINKIRSSDIKRRDQYCDNHYSILMKSNIFRWLRLKIGERIKKSDKELGYKVLEKNLKYYEQNIREVIEGAKSHKIKVIIVGLPGLYENRSLDEFKNYIQFSNMKPNEIEYRKKAFLSINKIKRKLAKEYSHVSYIDNGLSDNAIKKQDFFSDPVHPTGSGNRIMAYNIYESLIAQINNTSGNKDPNGNLAISKNKLELQYLKGLFASNRIEDLSSSGCIAVGKISCSAMHKTLTGPIYVTAAVEFALGSMLQFSSDIKTPELAEQIERILKISINIEPNFSLSHWVLGNLYYAKGEKDLAEKENKKALKLNPLLNEMSYAEELIKFEEDYRRNPFVDDYASFINVVKNNHHPDSKFKYFYSSMLPKHLVNETPESIIQRHIEFYFMNPVLARSIFSRLINHLKASDHPSFAQDIEKNIQLLDFGYGLDMDWILAMD